MRVTVKKGPTPRDGSSDEPQVIMETWMTTDEARDLNLNGLAYGDAVGEALTEHLRHRHTTSRNVRK